jgi:hypothetical protein
LWVSCILRAGFFLGRNQVGKYRGPRGHTLVTRLLYEARYMASPDFWCPGTWRLSAAGIPIPPVPQGAARQAAVHQHYYEVLTPKERNDPLWDPDNMDHWTAFFTERRLAELAHYEGNGPLPPNKNAATRKVWWGIEGCTLPAVLDHIVAGNHPRLTMPQRQHWLPRRMDGPVSSSSRSSSSTPRTPRGGGGVVIGSPTSAPTRLLRPKKEPGPGTSSARVKEPGSFTRVKKEHDTLAPPSSKKARCLTDEAARQLDYQTWMTRRSSPARGGGERLLQ